MQLEESGKSKDVPPLSSRGIFGLSTFVENKAAQLNRSTANRCIFSGSIVFESFQAVGFQEVPD